MINSQFEMFMLVWLFGGSLLNPRTVSSCLFAGHLGLEKRGILCSSQPWTSPQLRRPHSRGSSAVRQNNSEMIKSAE